MSAFETGQEIEEEGDVAAFQRQQDFWGEIHARRAVADPIAASAYERFLR